MTSKALEAAISARQIVFFHQYEKHLEQHQICRDDTDLHDGVACEESVPIIAVFPQGQGDAAHKYMDKLIREANCREIIRAYAENITEEMVNEAGETREQLRAAILKGLE